MQRSVSQDRLVGINIGGTTTTIVSGDTFGAVHETIRMATNPNEPGEAFYQTLVASVRQFAHKVGALGVAVGGPMNANTGVLLDPQHLPHLKGFPLLERLAIDIALPVRVHHDAAACALAEYRWGPNAGAGGIAYLTCGTGFGTGIVLDGRARYGRDGFAPEIGHVRFRDSGPDMFGKPGCYEGYGSANALALLARRRDPERFANSTPTEVVSAAHAGESSARAALGDNIEAVGSSCALLADVLALDVIALGSLANYLGETWVNDVRGVFEREALPYHVERCTIRSAMPGVQDRSALAAACDALEESNR
jgi:glucokinase